ncbi:PAS domain-containing sensor histidine kinase [Mesorhizobium sp. NBSH29]|uniref:PAS domain-containing sensor histidine kinase n=1 Tax=Mesorhizobium sp. NBSH29 TaxID=2654249 RepID=UPI0035BBB378
MGQSNAGDLEDLADLFETAPCGYISAEPNGKILRANDTLCAWLGRKPDDIVGRPFHDLLTIAGKIYFETHFAPLLRMQGFFNEVALDMVRADGTRLASLVNAVERRDGSGNLRFLRITVFNATDRRRYEQELLAARAEMKRINGELRQLNTTLEQRVAEEVAERMRAEATLRQAHKMEAVGQLTGGIAHDFNNMLAVVISGLNLIQRRLAKGETNVGALIDAAMEGANKAATLTHRLLAFSRQQPLSPEPIKCQPDGVGDV